MRRSVWQSTCTSPTVEGGTEADAAMPAATPSWKPWLSATASQFSIEASNSPTTSVASAAAVVVVDVLLEVLLDVTAIVDLVEDSVAVPTPASSSREGLVLPSIVDDAVVIDVSAILVGVNEEVVLIGARDMLDEVDVSEENDVELTLLPLEADMLVTELALLLIDVVHVLSMLLVEDSVEKLLPVDLLLREVLL
mmetsp:Transcript_7666/g.17858  ORF Transcript_7666/g.17858 Transcript_7666/m.17858 type:complete len:195 (-) Transcript_7666:1592-2176(-)